MTDLTGAIPPPEEVTGATESSPGGAPEEEASPPSEAPDTRPPPSSSTADTSQRVGLLQRVRDIWQDPNPVWVREMRQSARLTRTPLILALLTILAALVISAVGGVGVSNADPATVGTIIFHTFFSLAFAIVSWVGPGVAAMTIASERSGRTWETVLLTRMTAREVARGKFASAFTYISMYVVMLAPVGALTFLFGGVSAVEVMLAFAFLFVFSAISVGFGLSISSAVSNPTVAMLVTVPIAAVLSLGIYLSMGVGLSVVAHRFWPAVAEGAPVWLPTAYTRAEFGGLYLALLVFAPVSLSLVAASFFHEVTAANIAQTGDDRSSGLRKWFLASAPILALNFLLPRFFEPDRSEAWEMTVMALGAIQFFLGLCLFLFASEPLTRSQRVQRTFVRTQASRFRRFLGPGVEPALVLLLLVGFLLLGGVTAHGALYELTHPSSTGSIHMGRLASILSFGGYALCFLLFLAGFVLFVRARSDNGTAPRVTLLLVIFLANAGPWLLLAIAGMMGRVDQVLWLASPSPSFVFELFSHLLYNKPNAQLLLISMITSATLWALLGVLLWGLGSRRLRARLQEEATLRGQTGEAAGA